MLKIKRLHQFIDVTAFLFAHYLRKNSLQNPDESFHVLALKLHHYEPIKAYMGWYQIAMQYPFIQIHFAKVPYHLQQ